MNPQLLELRIRDFAIVDELTLALEPGLNALTGETGAGKSILIDALGAVLGDRAGPNLVRAGAERALVEATFSRPAELPEELELDEADDVVILSREIGANGRGAARLNGRTVPVSLLQTAGRALVDIHGQTDHQSLLRPGTHLSLLDRYAGLEDERRDMAALVRRLREARQEIERLQGDARELARQQDLLRFQVEEIDAADLQADELETLAARRSVLANAEKLRELASQALAALNDDGQAIDAASAAAKLLGDAGRLDPAVSEPAGEVEAALTGLQDAARSLARYVDAIEADPEELQRIEDRLDLIRGLQRKYGETIEEVLAFGDRARAQLKDILGADERLAELEAQAGRLSEQAWQLAQRLSEARAAAAARLEETVERELGDLNMQGARFVVSLKRRDVILRERSERRILPGSQPSGQDPSPAAQDDIGALRPTGDDISGLQATGIDDVEFLLAANRGEPPRPLAQVASGGETSRVMLALKSAFSAVDDTPVLVFDEIEAGVGARGGHVIGGKLRQLARCHQVLCITHLAPVAALADAHLRVRKVARGDRTSTAVDRLAGDERVEELAEMLAGRPIGESARASALELLEGTKLPT